MGRILFLLLLTVCLFFVARYLSAQPRLKDVVQKAQMGTNGDYAIVIRDLKRNEQFTQQEHKVYAAASLYKLWVMATVFQQIKEGKLHKDDVLSEDIATLNATFGIDSPGPGEETSGGITLTVQQALEQMITISHNYSALLLAKTVGQDQISAMVKGIGMHESSYETPQTTAHDTAIFFEKLYNGQIVDKKSSQEMIDILKRQQLNDRIPKYLPKTIQVGHKTGEIDLFKHDAGIIFTPQGDYIMIVLTESDSPSGAAERIALLSKAVYSYFSKRGLF